MKKILLISLCVFKLAMVEGQEKENSSVKSEDLKEVVVKGKRKLHKTLPFKKVSQLKKRVYAFDSYVIDDKLYVFGGDASSSINRARGAIDVSGMNIESFGQLLKVLRRFGPDHHEYSDKLQLFDLELGNWIENEVKLSNRAYHNINYYKGDFYVLGGKRFSKNKRFEYLNDKIEIVNVNSLSTTIDETNPHQAINFASDVYKNYLVVMGGSFKKNARSRVKYSCKTHFFDFTSGLWYELPKMPVAKETKGVLVRHKFYLVGGYNGKELTGVESFDFVSGEWKKEMDLPLPMKNPGLAVSKEQIFIYNKNVILVYDTRKDEMRKYYIRIELEESNLHVYQGALYIIGGFTMNGITKEPSGNIYKIDLKEFNKTEFDNF
ncbi:hypothetical protein [uncultured Tenacibaculum sp.]|uniref:hypothetical protein n=1 Tax=uncultured Tenacibaculum sp. TaxID=174713 RepID=UPI002630C939|nr:hypothetical protein [uncultured Tenacibaculum sp.]